MKFLFFFEWIVTGEARRAFLLFCSNSYSALARKQAITGLLDICGKEAVEQFKKIPESDIPAQIAFIKAAHQTWKEGQNNGV